MYDKTINIYANVIHSSNYNWSDRMYTSINLIRKQYISGACKVNLGLLKKCPVNLLLLHGWLHGYFLGRS